MFRLEFHDWSKSPNFDKTQGYSLAIFRQNELFGQFSLRASNLNSECPISKLKNAFTSFLKSLSNDVFRLKLCDWLKSIIYVFRLQDTPPHAHTTHCDNVFMFYANNVSKLSVVSVCMCSVISITEESSLYYEQLV